MVWAAVGVALVVPPSARASVVIRGERTGIRWFPPVA